MKTPPKSLTLVSQIFVTIFLACLTAIAIALTVSVIRLLLGLS